MGQVVDAAELEWQPVRLDVARGVYGKTLLADGVKVVLTRVVPDGRFSAHRDDYAHLFYFLGGQGLVWKGEQQFQARAGLAVHVAAGVAHAYENTGTEDLTLISINVPEASQCCNAEQGDQQSNTYSNACCYGPPAKAKSQDQFADFATLEWTGPGVQGLPCV